MATCRDIIKRGLRMLGVLQSGRDPTANEADDAMIALQGVYDALAHQGVFNRLVDKVIIADYTANENERILINTASAVTVTIPVTVDGEFDYEARPPRDLSSVQIRNAFTNARTHVIYDTFLGRWVSVVGLGLNDEAPLSLRCQQQLSARVAVLMAPEFQQAPSDPVVALSNRLNAAIGSMRDSVLETVETDSF